jgi:hypothetical protein
MLPDISALRQVTPDVLRAPAFLVRPGTSWRMRSTVGAGAGDGAAFHYVIGAEPPPVVTLEILITATGEVLRRFSSEAPAGSDDWLDRSPGLHRKVWDLRHAAPPVHGAPPANAASPVVAAPAAPATGAAAPRAIRGVAVLPGIYQVRLTAGGRSLRQAISISLDPRVRVSIADLTAQYALARTVDASQRKVATALGAATGAVASAAPGATAAATGSGMADAAGSGTAGLATGTTNDLSKRSALEAAGAELAAVARTLQQFDGRPTASVEAAASAAIARADAALAR